MSAFGHKRTFKENRTLDIAHVVDDWALGDVDEHEAHELAGFATGEGAPSPVVAGSLDV